MEKKWGLHKLVIFSALKGNNRVILTYRFEVVLLQVKLKEEGLSEAVDSSAFLSNPQTEPSNVPN